MNDKCIFLDIDGVLNATGDTDLIENTFSKKKMEYLKQIIDECSNVDIIITSDRRIYEIERKMIDKAFNQFNLPISYLSLKRIHKKRSEEVMWYLNGHQEVKHYVILDDNDLGYTSNEVLINHFIDTFPYGLSDTLVNEIINILMK